MLRFDVETLIIATPNKTRSFTWMLRFDVETLIIATPTSNQEYHPSCGLM